MKIAEKEGTQYSTVAEIIPTGDHDQTGREHKKASRQTKIDAFRASVDLLRLSSKR
jgi:hypothetical protein